MQNETARPGLGASGGVILAVHANADQDTPHSRTWQVWPDALAATRDADLLRKITVAAGMIAFTRERIDEMTTLVNELLTTIEKARNAAKRSIGVRGRRHHERLAFDAMNEAGMWLSIHRERRHVPLEPDQIRDALGWWLNAANAHLEVLADEAAFYLAIIGGDPSARDRAELRANDRLQQLDDFERGLYREVWS